MSLKPSVFVQPPWEGPSIRLFSNRGFPIVHAPELADIIVFNGGEDINPKLYGQDPIPGAGVYFDQSRDEVELAGYAKAKKAFKFGICRGGQLLNVLNGGSLWQDVNNHHRAHAMTDLETDETIWTSSVHHQQFILGPDAKLVAVAEEAHVKLGVINKRKYEWYRGDSEPQYNDDPEVVFYPNDRALCIQGHPEYAGYGQMTDYCMKLIERYY